MSRSLFAGVLELVGVSTLIGALFIISWPFAVATIGAFLILAALVIQKGGY
jgi:hypothetical protein